MVVKNQSIHKGPTDIYIERERERDYIENSERIWDPCQLAGYSKTVGIPSV